MADSAYGEEYEGKMMNQRPGWLGQVPGHYNGGMNDVSRALYIAVHTKDPGANCNFGTGFGENGEPEIQSADAWQRASQAPEFQPGWAYSTTNWMTDTKSPGGGNPMAGKG